MSSFKKGSLAVLALAATLASTATAQQQRGRPATQRAAAADQGFWELGTDLGVAIGIDDPRTFVIDVPTGLLRAGYYITPDLTLEPALTFNSVAQESATAASAWFLQLGGLYHLSPDRRANQFFVHPAIGFTGGSGGGPNFTILSGTFGMKKPLLAGRLVMRGEAGLAYRLKEGPVDAATRIIANVGWSLYTR